MHRAYIWRSGDKDANTLWRKPTGNGEESTTVASLSQLWLEDTNE
jgi:hypothetical protein